MQSTKNKHLVAGLVGAMGVLSLIGASSASAQESDRQSAPINPPPVLAPIDARAEPRKEIANTNGGFRKEVRDIQEVKKAGVADIRHQASTTVKNIRTGTKDAIEANRKEMRGEREAVRADGTTTPEERDMLKAKRDSMRDENEALREARHASTTAAFEKAREDMKQKRDQAHEDIKKALEDRKAKIGAIKDQAKEQRAQEALKKASEHASNIIEKLTDTVTKIEELQVRVASRIDKMAIEGKDVTEATSKLEESKSHSAMARESITKISSTFATLATTADPKKGLGKFASSTEEVRGHIVKSREALNQAVRSLQDLNRGAPAPTTTTTPPAAPATPTTPDTTTTTQ